MPIGDWSCERAISSVCNLTRFDVELLRDDAFDERLELVLAFRTLKTPFLKILFSIEIRDKGSISSLP